ncbi:MAG: DUF2142 domain-containing protein [Oscillospiraceae bacterium]|nr:DUF2142 domain-containing protein [Oscillospiraceae bacterium]
MDDSKKKKTIILCVASLAFVISCVLIWAFAYSQNGTGHFFPMNVLIGKSGLSEKNSITLSEGDTVEFSFVSFDAFSDLFLYVETPETATIEATLYDGAWVCVSDRTVNMEKNTNRFVSLFSELSTVDQREVYVLRIDVRAGENIRVASRNGGTALKASGGFPFTVFIFILINALIYTALVGLYYSLWIKKYPLYRVFLCVAIPVVIVFSILLYPGTACDENDHYIEAYRLSNRIMGVDEDVIRAEDVSIVESRWAVPNLEGTYMAVTLAGHRSGETSLVDNSHQGHVGKAIVYILPAIGISLGRILKLNAFTTYYFARGLNILLYLFVGSVILRIAKSGKGILFCFLLLPLTINQCISVNQDAFCFLISFLAIAYWTRVRYNVTRLKRRLSAEELLCIISLFLVLLSCKAYVLVMSVFCVLPWNEMYGISWKKMGILFGTVAIAVAAGVGALEIMGQGGYARHFIDALLGKANEQSYSLMYFLDSPFDFVFLVGRTVKEQAFTWFWDAFGSRLSWETYFSPVYAIIFAIIIYLAAKEDEGDVSNIPLWGKVIIFIVFFGFGGIVVIRALSWTSIGRKTIWGIQGRYFIPMLPTLYYTVIQKRKNSPELLEMATTAFVFLLLVLCSDLLNLHMMTYLVE